MAWRISQSPPESIKYVIDELFETEILSKFQKERMCSSEELAIAADPNLEMKLRHQKAKKRSQRMDKKRSFARNEIISEAKRIISREELLEKEMQLKNQAYDRELKQFKMDLAKSTQEKKMFEHPTMIENNPRKIQKRPKSCSYVDISINEHVETFQFKINNGKEIENKELKQKRDYLTYPSSIQAASNYEAVQCIVDINNIKLPPVFVDIQLETCKKCDIGSNEQKLQDSKQSLSLQHYWHMWRDIVNARKIHKRVRGENTNRIAKINSFVSELCSHAASMKVKKKERTEPCPYLPQTKICAKISEKLCIKKRQNTEDNPCEQVSLEKLVIQQKNKLQEQQKIISQLRLEQIKLATERSAQQAQIYLESSLQEVSLPAQRKLNYLKSTFPSILDRHYNKPKPNFLIQMEARQKERQKRKEELKEKTRLKILEQQKSREEKERIQKEHVEEERRLEHEIKIQKLQERARNRIHEQLATKFCQLRRLRLGFEAFKKSLQFRETQFLLVQNYFILRNTQCVFRTWRLASDNSVQKRIHAAQSFYQSSILRNAWNTWKQINVEVKQDRQVADDFYDLIVVSSMFQTWRNLILVRYKSLCKDLDQARQFYNRRTLARSLSSWRRLRETRDEERRVERKKEALRNSVRLIIPDFNPSRTLPLFPTIDQTFSQNTNFCPSNFEVFITK